jgi:hypothetical protein
MAPSPTLTLAEAGLRLGLSYHQIRGRLLQGELKGGRDSSGRYYVHRASVEAAQRRQRLAAPKPTGLKRGRR